MPAAVAPVRGSLVSQLMRHYGMLVPMLMLGMIGILLFRLPGPMMDFLLAFNLTLSIIILLTTLYVTSPLEFSVFPSLLLLATLYRLVLNVATTRLILDNRERSTEAAGRVIQVFGEIVAANNPVIGFILFFIIIIVQFVVITRGATRISEVAARFTLDGMPGKQMSIDADLNSGLITEEEARARRQEITAEADFYGAMDGASKFVRGDAIAGIIITIVNIVGGLIIGTAMLGMSLREAADVFTKLTIGDGLVSQIPAFIVSMSAALLVTRATAKANLGEEVIGQLGTSHAVLMIAAAFLVGIGIIFRPMFFPMLALAALLGFIGFMLRRTRHAALVEQRAEAARAAPARAEPERVESLLKVDPMELRLGYGLVKLVDAAQGGDLLERVTMIRRQMALEVGIVIPPVRIRDDMQLPPNDYIICIKGNVVARGSVMPDHYLAMESGAVTGKVPGVETKEPAFGLSAVWITEGQRSRAEMLGYTVVDCTTVVATHLTEVIRSHADELLTREEVNKLINNLKGTSPAVVEEVVPNILKVGEVQKVLQNLLRERVSIRDLETILETLGDYGARTRDIDVLTEYARNSLARSISNDLKDESGTIHVVTLDPKLEDTINNAVEHTDRGSFLRMSPADIQRVCQAIGKEVEKLVGTGRTAIVLCSPQIRLQVKRMTEPFLPQLVVISYNEVSKDVRVESVGMVTLGGLQVREAEK